MRHRKSSRILHAALITVMGLLVSVVVFLSPGLMGALKPIPEVHAQFSGTPDSKVPMIVPCVPPASWVVAPGLGVCTDEFQYKQTIGQIQDRWQFQLMVAAFMGFFDQLTYIGQTLAYNTAEWVASGGKSQTPMFWDKGFGDYMKGVLLDSVGEFMVTFSEESVIGDLGLNLCAPPNFPELALDFSLSVPDINLAASRPTPRCPWNQFRDNWKTAASSFSNVESLGNIRGTFTSGGNDFAFGTGAHVAMFDAVAEHREAAILERLEGRGYRAVEDYVT
ncbi:hypothetical protein GF380_03565, partial [Candidatus Uhrbacteria bacterium]|nr:hypothetical protein [Candidatus Uhrbacteria bacterium]